MSDFRDQLPRTAHMFSMMIAHLNSALNPILYGLFNPAFQRGYMRFMKMMIYGKKVNFNRTTLEQTMHVSIVDTKN